MEDLRDVPQTTRADRFVAPVSLYMLEREAERFIEILLARAKHSFGACVPTADALVDPINGPLCHLAIPSGHTISLDFVSAEAQSKIQTFAFKQEDYHVEGSKRQ